jgi:DNA anti-recombination protein RmuC
MSFLQREWKTVLIIVWLLLVTVFLFQISGKIERLNQQNARISSTLDSVESIVLSTDSGVVQVGKKVGNMETNVDNILQRVRRK